MPKSDVHARWQTHKDTIERLYLDENKTLSDLMHIMDKSYGFKMS